MRILAFSDIHGNAYAMERFMEAISVLSFDKIAFLGDIFGYYYEQEKCLRLLGDIPDLIWLKGNHDEYAVRAYCGGIEEADLIELYGHSYKGVAKRFRKADMENIASLPVSEILECDGKRIGFFHGRPQSALEGRIYNDTVIPEEELYDYDVVIIGHTHCKIDRRLGEKRVLSPGSLGQPRDGNGYGFMVYDTQKGTCEFINVEVDNSYLRKEIDKRDSELKKLYEVLSREKDL